MRSHRMTGVMVLIVATTAFILNLLATWIATHFIIHIQQEKPDRFWNLVVASDTIRQYMRWLIPAVWVIPKRILAEGHHETAALVQLVLMSSWTILLVVAAATVLPVIWSRDNPPSRLGGPEPISSKQSNRLKAGAGALLFGLPAIMTFWAGGLTNYRKEIFHFDPYARPADVYFIGIFLSLAAFGFGLLHFLRVPPIPAVLSVPEAVTPSSPAPSPHPGTPPAENRP